MQPLLLDLVDQGTIRIVGIAFVAKDADGSVSGLELGDLKETAAAFVEFEGASSGRLGFDLPGAGAVVRAAAQKAKILGN